MRRDLHIGKFLWGQANRGYYDKSDAAKKLNRARHRLRCYLYGQTETYVPHIETTIYGIPCGIVVESYTPGHNGGTDEPPCCADAEWFVVDRHGYRADWLQDKMDWSDIRRIDGELGV